VTLLLRRSEVQRLGRPLQLMHVIRQALSGEVSAPPASLVLMERSPTPLLHLLDAQRSALAILEAAHLLSVTTNLTAAIGCDALAKREAKTVAVLGSGREASGAVKALRLVRTIDRVHTFETDLAANTELVLRLQGELNTAVRGFDTAEAAVAEADIVLLTGGVPLPTDCVSPGAHVTMLRSSQVPASLVARAMCFHDWASEPISGSTAIGRLLTTPPASLSSNDITLFRAEVPQSLVLYAAWSVYEGARGDGELLKINFDS
jgi:hypothetical protein